MKVGSLTEGVQGIMSGAPMATSVGLPAYTALLLRSLPIVSIFLV